MSRKKGENRKKRPCLKCDKMFETTPEFRLCPRCTQAIKASGADTGYSVLSEFGRRLDAFPAAG